MHELSELLFKVQAGRVSNEHFDAGEFGMSGAEVEDFGNDNYQEEEEGGVNNHFQNNFTITEVKSKPFVKKRGGRKRR